MKKQLLFLLSLVIAQNFSMGLSDWSEKISGNLTWENAKTVGFLAISSLLIYDRFIRRTPKVTAPVINASTFVTTQVLAQYAKKQDLLINGKPITELFTQLVKNSVKQQENIQGLVDLTGEKGDFYKTLIKMAKELKEHGAKIGHLQIVLAGLKPVINNPAFKEFFETTQSSELLDIPILLEDDEQDLTYQDLTNKVEKLEGHLTDVLIFFNGVTPIQKNSKFQELYDKIMSEDQIPLDLLDLGLYPGTPDSYSGSEYSSSDDDQENSQSSLQHSPIVIKITTTESSTDT